MNLILAIFKRNFFSYFANPTGYVFICGFVLVSGFAAFWSHEFFNANLANLDQLNKVLPFIMLGFVPAITMSIWADERRQGTDELLLTLPASDLHVVLGKYLAAVAIFTVSLLFSLSNVFVLVRLGNPDAGLLLTTYLGYWFVGIAMLAIGMVASFLTANLTVGFVLGVALNAPLVFAANADVIISDGSLVQSIRQWSISAMFADFARGVVSLASVAYFLSLVVIGLYMSMVLIGRRHWITGRGGASGGGKGGSMWGHFAVRAISVLIIAIGVSFIFRIHDVRVDASSEKLSSLSPRSADLLSALGDRRMSIEAFISPESEVPEGYIQTRLNLLNTLNEIQKRSNGKVAVRIFETDKFKPEKTIAQQRYDITARTVYMQERGQIKQYDLFLGVAINSGLDKKVIPFFDRGVPTEYELIGAIVSLSRQNNRKTIGVVKTDAQLMGQTNPMAMMGGGSNTPAEQFITELRKQYEVLEVDPSAPIENRYDALLVVQPSSLEQPQLDNLVAAIKRGIPTAIFEDPQPILAYGGGRTPPPPGTLEPRRPQQMDPMMMRMGMQPQAPGPKGKLSTLWDAIGAEIPVQKKKSIDDSDQPQSADVIDIVWQDFNPFPRASTLDNEVVFVGKGGGTWASNDPITKDLNYVMFPFAGTIVPRAGSKLSFTALATTGTNGGTVDTGELFEESPMGGRAIKEDRKRAIGKEPYVLAARIQGKASADSAKINVVLVSDSDLFASWFFGHRDTGADERMPFFFDVDNVTFALNIVDSLAGEDSFFEIRSRRRVHRTLTAFEKSTETARKQTLEENTQATAKFEEKLEEIQKQGQQRILDLAKERMTGDIDDRQFAIKRDAAEEQLSRVLTVERERLRLIRDERVEKAESDLELSIRRIQNSEKRLAVFLPPILPLIIALIVFGWRRSRELEGAVKSRVR